MLVCPSCGSSRIRNGYKPSMFVLRIVGIRALLCDNCNYPFQAFSPFPPKTRRPKQFAKADVYPVAPAVDLEQLKPSLPVAEPQGLKLVPPVSAKPVQSRQSESQPVSVAAAVTAPSEATAKVVVDRVAPARQGLRTEITKLYAQRVQEKSEELPQVIHQTSLASLACPECQSRNVKRRRRNFFERIFLAFTDHKPFICRNCDAVFYSKSSEQEDGAHRVGRAEVV